MKLPDRPPPNRTETVIKSEIRAAVHALGGCITFNNPVGECDLVDKKSGAQYHIVYGLAPNSSDLICCCWGRFVVVEVKTPKKYREEMNDERRKAQADWIALVESYGAIGGFAWDVESALAIVEKARPPARWGSGIDTAAEMEHYQPPGCEGPHDY